MPLFKNTVTGVDFTGASPTTGLFAVATGHDQIQVQVRSLSFHTNGTPCDVLVVMRDPAAPLNTTKVISAVAAADMYVQGVLLPTEAGASWELVVITSGQDGDGFLNIDFDLVNTEG